MQASAAVKIEMDEPTTKEVFVALLKHLLRQNRQHVASPDKLRRLSNQLAPHLTDVLAATDLKSLGYACGLALAFDDVRDAMEVLDTDFLMKRLISTRKGGWRIEDGMRSTLAATEPGKQKLLAKLVEEVYDCECAILSLPASSLYHVEPTLGRVDTLTFRDMPREAGKYLDRRFEAFVCLLALDLAAAKRKTLDPAPANAILDLIKDAQERQLRVFQALLAKAPQAEFDLERVLQAHNEWRKSVHHFLAQETVVRANPYNDGDNK